MNTLHLQYLIEIERMCSISQAAENLYIGQPNLSRILHDMEENIGFRIFERINRGVRPTERGARFLQHARSILRELEYIDALGPQHAVSNRLRVCLPSSASLIEQTAAYLASLNTVGGLESGIHECHAAEAISMISNGDAEIAVLRFRSEYTEYFNEQSVSQDLSFQILKRYKYEVLLPQDHPLAEKKTLRLDDLTDYPEIVHSDLRKAVTKEDKEKRRQIYTVDRMAQFQLLETIWGAYMWSEPIPSRHLQRWGLVQRPCSDNQYVYVNAIIYNPKYAMTEIETGFIQYMIRESKK